LWNANFESSKEPKKVCTEKPQEEKTFKAPEQVELPSPPVEQKNEKKEKKKIAVTA
jgi:hypothetical protein